MWRRDAGSARRVKDCPHTIVYIRSWSVGLGTEPPVQLPAQEERWKKELFYPRQEYKGMPGDTLHSQIHLIVYESEYRTLEKVRNFCLTSGIGHVIVASREIGEKQEKPHHHIALVLNGVMRDKPLRDVLKQWFKEGDEKANSCYSIRAWDSFKVDYNLEQYICKGKSAVEPPDMVFDLSQYEAIVQISKYEARTPLEHWGNFWGCRHAHQEQAKKQVKEKASQAAQKTKEVISKVLADIKEQYDTTAQRDILERVIVEYKGAADDRTIGLTTQRIFFITDRTNCVKQQLDRVWSRFFCMI